jgi:transcriptional regulator with XRE-family HTH domain
MDQWGTSTLKGKPWQRDWFHMLNKEQLRAARGWLGLSQNEVAQMSKVATKTIKNFERGASIPYERTLRDIQKALEKLGIEFVFDGGEGIGIRIHRPGSPPSGF